MDMLLTNSNTGSCQRMKAQGNGMTYGVANSRPGPVPCLADLEAGKQSTYREI